MVEADLTTSRLDDCARLAAAIDDAALLLRQRPMMLIRDTMRLACQWGGDKRPPRSRPKRCSLPETAQLAKTGWDFAGMLHFLASCPAFADGRASWIALFQSLEDGNGAAMTGALDQLEEVMKH